MTKEDALEPDLPICDPHHHLWDTPDDFPENLITASHRHVRHYLLTDFLKDAGGGHNITQTVFIECGAMYRKDGPPEMRPVGQTEFVQGIAAQAASGLYGNTLVAAGIVGYADLALSMAVAPVLEANIAASRNRFRGVRFQTTWDASPAIDSRTKSPNYLADPVFRQGFSCLERYNLSYDAWLYHPQISDLVDLANAFPGIPIILNHTGGPLGIGPYAGKSEEVFQVWKRGIMALAACPNVSVKLGGLGMPRIGFDWHARPRPVGSEELAKSMAPYFNWCIEKFGVKRCMFESNFPVDKESFSYTIIWNAFKRITKDFSATERTDLFHNTAIKVYRLSDQI